MNNRPDIDKIHLYAKDPYEAKYQYLINKLEKVGLNHLGKERKVLIVFDDMIAEKINDKKVNTVVTELFIRNKKLNISIVLVTKSYFKVPKEVRLNTRHFFIAKIPNKRKLQQIVLNYSSDIDFISFIKIYKIKSILQNYISF